MGNYNPQYAQYYASSAGNQNNYAAQPYSAYGNYGGQQPIPSQPQQGNDKK